MQKNKSLLISKVVLICLVINTLPIHLPMYGSALPKGQELIVLEQEINSDISSINKTISTLKKLRIIVPSVIIGTGVVAAIVAAAVVTVLTLAIKKKFEKRIKNKEALKQSITRKLAEFKGLQSLAKDFNVLKKEQKNLTMKLIKSSKARNAAETLNTQEIKKFFSEMKVFFRNPIVGRDAKKAAREHFLNSIRYYVDQIGNPLEKLLPKKNINFIALGVRKELFENFKSYLIGFAMDLQPLIEFQKDMLKKIDKHEKTTGQSLDKVKQLIKEMLSKVHTKSTLQANLSTTMAEKKDLVKRLEGITKNKTIIGIIIAAISGVILTQAFALAGIALASFSVAVVAAGKKAKRLEVLEEKYPGILTLRQRRMLKEFKEIMTDPKMQGLVTNMHLRVALSNAAEETVKQYPFLVTALGGSTKASAAFEKYAKRKWEEAKLQRALDVGVGKLMALKMKTELGIRRATLRTQGNKLISQVKKAQLDVAQLKTALSSTAQSYIKQADAILEDFKNKLAEAIEAGKLDLQKTEAQPIIEL